MKAYQEDDEIVAKTLWGEARGEGREGMKAVLGVIVTRANIARHYMELNKRHHPLYGNGTLASACLVRFQFSCWLVSDPNRSKIMSDIDDAAMRAARSLVEEYWVDPNTVFIGATHYLTSALYHSANCPKWAKSLKQLFIVGNHIFFRGE